MDRLKCATGFADTRYYLYIGISLSFRFILALDLQLFGWLGIVTKQIGPNIYIYIYTDSRISFSLEFNFSTLLFNEVHLD